VDRSHADRQREGDRGMTGALAEVPEDLQLTWSQGGRVVRISSRDSLTAGRNERTLAARREMHSSKQLGRREAAGDACCAHREEQQAVRRRWIVREDEHADFALKRPHVTKPRGINGLTGDQYPRGTSRRGPFEEARVAIGDRDHGVVAQKRCQAEPH
jgi:hypothetical protein